MKMVSFTGSGEVAVVDGADPVLKKPTDAILRVTAAGICGSDLRALRIAAGDRSWPVGHEFAGVVEAVGTAVSSFRVGDRCGAPMYTTCGNCLSCSVGDQDHCAESAIFGTSRSYGREPGGQAEFVLVPNADRTLVRLPDGVSDDDAILLSDILPTAMTILEKVNVRIGDDILIVGCGPVGQLITMCAPLFGAARIYVKDLDPKRLDQAVEFGGIPWPEPEVAAQGEPSRVQVHAAIDATGNPAALRTAYDSLVNEGGRLGLVNVAVGEPLPFDSGEFWGKRARVISTLGNPHRWRHALIHLIESGRLTPSRVVSNHLALSEAQEAYELFAGRHANKVVLVP